MEYLKTAKNVFEIEIKALELLKEELGTVFESVVEKITHCTGKVILIGMGKSGHIAKKISATMSSLGIASFFIHPAEALHGDLGMISSQDIVIMISYSGESDEIIGLIPSIKMIGSFIIGITGNKDSQLAQSCDILQVLPEMNEACILQLAPTSSTTAVLVYGDALAVAASETRGFTREKFAIFHPCGALGKKLLLKVSDIMIDKEDSAVICKSATFKEAVIEMCMKSSRIVSVVEENDKLFGIITDGDIRRTLENGILDYDINAASLCTNYPKVVKQESLAIDSLAIIREMNITALPVVDQNNTYVGTLGFQELLKAGIV